MTTPDFEPPCAAGGAHADIRQPDAAVDYRERLNRLLPPYPDARPPDPELRPALHPLCQLLREGISEFTFANLFLFRHAHNYALCRLDDSTPAVLGRDGDTPFFMLPFGLPERALLDRLFQDHKMLKAASATQAERLRSLGYQVREDRDNFDYLYRREDLAELSGRTYSKKRNLIKAFLREHEYEARPLREEYLGHALQVLEATDESLLFLRYHQEERIFISLTRKGESLITMPKSPLLTGQLQRLYGQAQAEQTTDGHQIRQHGPELTLWQLTTTA